MPFMLPLFSLSYPVLNYLTTIKLILVPKRPARMQVPAPAGNSGGRMAALKAGEIAPEIELPGVTGKQRQRFKLSDLRGKKNVVLAFYPLDWSPT